MTQPSPPGVPTSPWGARLSGLAALAVVLAAASVIALLLPIP